LYPRKISPDYHELCNFENANLCAKEEENG